ITVGYIAATIASPPENLGQLGRPHRTQGWASRRPGHIDTPVLMGEELRVEMKREVVTGSEHVAQFGKEPRNPVRSQAHELVFVAVRGQAEELRESRVVDAK